VLRREQAQMASEGKGKQSRDPALIRRKRKALT